MKLISFEPWEDDDWSNRQLLKLLVPVFIVLLGFAWITLSLVPALYAGIAFAFLMFFLLEPVIKKFPVLGFGKARIIPVALVLGIIVGGIFVFPHYTKDIHVFTMASLSTTQEAQLIHQFLNNMSLRISLDTVNYWVQFFYQAIVAPLIEELTFRGWLIIFLSQVFRNWKVGVFGSNIAFGLFHLLAYGAVPGAVAFAIFFGLVVTVVDFKTKSLIPGIVGHFINNIVFGGFLR
jgi:membrane protease YdiL (CAAX protease family)